MNYPLITEYIDAIRSAEDNFDKLTNLRPILDSDGQPVMSSGNFAVVFKMEDISNGKLYAVKCFLKEQEDRAKSYQLISDELNFLQSGFLVTIKYLNKELFVDSNIASEEELPVVLMDWVEGETLDKFVRNNIHNKYQLSLLAYQFSRLSMWLLAQPFAHGDLKPDNIIVRKDGTLTLVDYDGMYVPAMRGQKARELGSPDFRHPSRTEDCFDEHIDDFSIASIMLSLKAIAIEPDFLAKYGAEDRLLLSEENYRDISECNFLNEISNTKDSELRKIKSLFNIAVIEGNLSKVSFRLFSMRLPQEELFATEQMLIPYRKGDKWGFCNTNKQIVIAPHYDDASPFSEGLAIVGLNGKSSYIDKTGKEVTPIKYNYANNFSEGLAAVNLDGKWGYIDKTGKEVIPFKYDRGVFGYNDCFSEGFAPVILDGKCGYIDKTGKEVIPFKYDYARPFSEGLARVELNGKYGFVDKNGREVIPIKYDLVLWFSEGFAAVNLDGKCGYIDKTGKEIIPLKYDVADLFSEEFAAVKLDGKWGFIDKTGKEVIPFKYDGADLFSEEFAAVNLDGKWGYIDKTGKEVIPLKYDYARPFSEGLAAVELDKKYGFVDKTGKEVILIKYYEVWSSFSEGLAKVRLNWECGYIDKNGTEFFED